MRDESQLTVYSSCQKKQNCLRVLEVLSIEGQLLHMNITHTDHLTYYLKKRSHCRLHMNRRPGGTI